MSQWRSLSCYFMCNYNIVEQLHVTKYFYEDPDWGMAALERLWYLSKYLIFLPLYSNFNFLVSIWGRRRSGSAFVFWVKYLNILFCGLCWARIKVSVVLFRGYILVSEQTFLHYGVFVYQHILWHRFSIWKISKTNTIKFSSCHGPQKIKFSHKKLICSLPWPEQ